MKQHWKSYPVPIIALAAIGGSQMSVADTFTSARLKSDWPADIEAYAKIHGQILKMGDMLSDGIIPSSRSVSAGRQVSGNGLHIANTLPGIGS